MLVQFSVQNYRSIKDLCELSMVASNYFKENEELNTFESGVAECPRLLKSIVIYGPNASGKTTIINAMRFVHQFVRRSAKDSQLGEPIDVSPFKLSSETRSADSFFEVIFIEDGVRYEYGLCANPVRVTEEWLIAYPKGIAQKWFHRVFDTDSDEYAYKFSRSFEGGRRRKDWQMQTRSNASFLSVAVQLNNTQLLPVYNWFSEKLATLKPDGLSHEFTASWCQDKEIREKVIDFIASADIALKDIVVQKRKFSEISPFPESMPVLVREELEKTLRDNEFFEVSFVREDNSGQPVTFSLEEESQGTQGLFNFAGPWIDVITDDMVLLVDELDSSLHPLIVHHLVDILHKSGSKAQIIFTTHDTTILSQKILRRDQIWLVEKDRNQGSILYPLSDYKVRDGEAIEKGYLSGRYGAVPFIKDLSFDGNRQSVSRQKG